MQVKILIGTVAFMLTMIVFGYAALREPTRLEHFTLAAEARQIETGAELYVNNCATCHGVEAKAQECYDAAGNPIACQGLPLNYAPLLCGTEPERLELAGWDGTKESFILRTVAAGRGAIMPAWSERYGGPMRDDQVQNVTAFVLNFESEELCSGPPPVAYEFPETYEEFRNDYPEDGDLARGEELYTLNYGCAGCHGQPDEPGWEGTGPWLGDIEVNAPERVPDYSVEQYVYESILHPGAYVVAGYADGLMPRDFAQRMALTEEMPQDLVDIMAYTIDGQ